MLYPPDRFERSWVVRAAWDDVPMNMRKLVAEEFVVDLLGFKDLRENLGDQIRFFYQLNPLSWCQVKELRGMPLKNHHRPSGEKLIVMEIGVRQSKVGDEMVLPRPGALAGFACRVGHG